MNADKTKRKEQEYFLSSFLVLICVHQRKSAANALV